MISLPVAMMQTLKPAMVLFAVLYLAACSGTKPAASFSDTFATEITANGTKFFTYVRHFAERTQPDETLHKAVKKRLETSGYCRDGYLTLERYHANGIARIRGECRDGASDSDREQFPDLP